MIAFVMIFFWVPETKQRTLEELDYVFGLPTSKFVTYQVRKALPWFIKRWVLFQKGATLEPLYQFDTDSSSTENLDDTLHKGSSEKKDLDDASAPGVGTTTYHNE